MRKNISCYNHQVPEEGSYFYERFSFHENLESLKGELLLGGSDELSVKATTLDFS